MCGVLLLIDRRRRLRPGRLFVVYVGGYTFARFFIERLRIDTANKIAGLRVNEWVSALIFLGAVAFLAVDWMRHRDDPPPGEETVETVETDDEDASLGEAGADDGDPSDADTVIGP